MVSEEQKKLVNDLRHYQPPKRIHPAYGTALHLAAADEIERLAKELEEARDIATRMAERWTKAIGIDAGFDRKIPE